jgi:hypothetical protein
MMEVRALLGGLGSLYRNTPVDEAFVIFSLFCGWSGYCRSVLNYFDFGSFVVDFAIFLVFEIFAAREAFESMGRSDAHAYIVLQFIAVFMCLCFSHGLREQQKQVNFLKRWRAARMRAAQDGEIYVPKEERGHSERLWGAGLAAGGAGSAKFDGARCAKAESVRST